MEEDVGADESAFMPVERSGGAALLKTFTRFVEGALRDLVNVNTSAEYRGPDGVKAERSRVGKSKSLFTGMTLCLWIVRRWIRHVVAPTVTSQKM